MIKVPLAAQRARERREREKEYRAEMNRRRRDMRALQNIEPAKIRKAWLDDDLEAFEAVMCALMNSDLPESAADAAPPFAALLVRIAEQTVAEFGQRAAWEAFDCLAESVGRLVSSSKSEPRP